MHTRSQGPYSALNAACAMHVVPMPINTNTAKVTPKIAFIFIIIANKPRLPMP